MTEETKEDEVNWAELRPQLIRIGLEIGPLLIFFLCTTFCESWLDASPALRSMFASPIIFATAPSTSMGSRSGMRPVYPGRRHSVINEEV